MAIDLRAVLRALWRGKFVIAATVIVACLLALFYLSSRTLTYEAAASVLVDGGSAQQLDLRTTGEAPLNASAVASQVNVLLSNRVLGAVVDTLGLASDPVFVPPLRPDTGGFNLGDARVALGKFVEPVLGPIPFLLGRPERDMTDTERADLYRRIAISTLAGKLSARQVDTSYIIRLYAQSNEPTTAAELANTVVRSYIEATRSIKLESSTSAVVWLTDQIAELEDQVRRSTDAVNEFRIANGLTDEGQVEQYAAQLDRLRSSLFDARQVRETLLTEQAAADTDAGVTDNLDRRITAIRSREDALAQRVEEAEAELSSLVALQAQFDQLQRQALADQRLYERFLDETNVVDALETYQQADARIIADALSPLQASNPGGKIILALAGILGIGAGIAIIALAELLNTTFRTREELAGFTKRPVLGVLPRWRSRLTPAKLIAFVRSNSGSALAENLRSMRAAVLQHHAKPTPGVVLITSASSSEGKSNVALLLAASTADIGKDVLFIDCDLRRSRLAKGLKLKTEHTLGTILDGTSRVDDAIVSMGERLPDVIVAARAPRQANVSPIDLLSSEAMADLIADLRRDYDTIILDAPPLLPVTDAAILSRHAESVIFVTEWRKSSQAAVADAMDVLGSFGAEVDGFVLNGVDLKAEASFRAIPQTAYSYQNR
ncbi:MAG: Wzz/FepE/Etk N-terminal domain-containing protein [Pseudomonadota bacterium]